MPLKKFKGRQKFNGQMNKVNEHINLAPGSKCHSYYQSATLGPGGGGGVKFTFNPTANKANNSSHQHIFKSL
jgi:hypothetical protein